MTCNAIIETILVSNFNIDGNIFQFEFWSFQYFCLFAKASAFHSFYPVKGILKHGNRNQGKGSKNEGRGPEVCKGDSSASSS